jgi:hypothetical protein
MPLSCSVVLGEAGRLRCPACQHHAVDAATALCSAAQDSPKTDIHFLFKRRFSGEKPYFPGFFGPSRLDVGDF